MNITYLIGAGASAAAIPPVGNNFNDRFIAFCKLLLHYSKRGNPGDLKRNAFISQAIDELPKHYSVDTYGRKIFFRGNKEYEAFKILLSAYFLFEQIGSAGYELEINDTTLSTAITQTFPFNKKKLDPRYDVVYAALLDESSRRLPGNIHFISWNYDVQFELSLCGFLGIPITHAFTDLKVYPAPWGHTEKDAEKAQFLKLNGTAGLIFKHGGPGYVFDAGADNFSFGKARIENCVNDIENALAGQESNFESMLHFAWENKPEIQAARKQAKEILKATEILIIIGYSFPLYNRKIDREILTELKASKIHLQVLEKDFEAISERFVTTLRSPGKVIQVKDLDQFFIPDEVI